MSKLVIRHRDDSEADEPAIVRKQRIARASADAHWWTADAGKDRGAALSKCVELIENQTTSQRAAIELCMLAYGAGNVAGQGLAATLQWARRQTLRLRLNLIEQVIDAMQAKVAKLRPRPAFITTQGDWGLRKRAVAMEQAVDGEFYRNNVDETSPQVAVDAFVTGTGFWNVGRRGLGYPVIDRVYPGEVIVDPIDGMYGAPRSLYKARLIDRDYLIDTFARTDKTKAAQLRRVPASNARAFSWLRVPVGHSDLLYVIEAWHLPSLPDAGDGVHTIVAGDVELLAPKQTEFTDADFPVVPLRWQTRQFGYFGRGIAEEIMPQQIEINYTLEKIQHILHNVSTVRHWVQGGGRIALNVQKMTNSPGEILTYYGANPPITDVINAVPPELFQHVITLKSDAFEAVGLSQFFATSDKPAGLDSGEALRTFEDVGTERLAIKGRAYEHAHVLLAQRVVDIKRAIAQPNSGEKETPVVVKSKRARGITIRSLSFKDVDLAADTYMLECAPQSGLPGTPTGRKAAVSEWIQIGLCTPAQGRDLLNMPDLQSSDDEEFATRNSVLSAIEMMADDGDYVPPHSLLDIQQAKKLVASAFTRLEWEGCPEDHLELIARYASQLLVLEQAALPAPAPMAALPAGPGPLNAPPGSAGMLPAGAAAPAPMI